MPIDLSQFAGFPLVFDPDALDVAAGEIRFSREARFLDEMAPVLRQPLPAQAGKVGYYNFKLTEPGDDLATVFQQRHLTFGLVLIPPGKVGQEYIKTHGHYHSAIPGSQIGYPEVYTHFYGTLYLLMQRRRDPAGHEIDDCVLYRMLPGHSITIPPGYAHVLINPSSQPGLMAGLYSLDSKHNYDPIDRMAGAAHYLIDGGREECVVANPAYIAPPPLRRLTNLTGTAFEPPDNGTPLWRSFTDNPDRYLFLYDAGQAGIQFAPEDLRL